MLNNPDATKRGCWPVFPVDLICIIGYIVQRSSHGHPTVASIICACFSTFCFISTILCNIVFHAYFTHSVKFNVTSSPNFSCTFS